MNQENKPESLFNRHLDESLESWKLRLESINNTDAFKMCQAMVEKQEPSCYGDIALLMLEYASQHSYTEQKLIKAAQLGQDFSSGNASTIKYDTIEDMIKDNFDIFHTPPTYTQEQMLAFGEVVKQECAKEAKAYAGGHVNKESILDINIKIILKCQ